MHNNRNITCTCHLKIIDFYKHVFKVKIKIIYMPTPWGNGSRPYLKF